MANSVWDWKAERCHVARLEVDSGAPDTVGLQERERTEGPGCWLARRRPHAGQVSRERGYRVEWQKEGGRGGRKGKVARRGEKKGINFKNNQRVECRGKGGCVCCFLRAFTATGL